MPGNPLLTNATGMHITIPDTVIEEAGLTEDRVRLEVALALFRLDALTLAQAARLAGLHRMRFQAELARREIPLHYGVDELEEDARTLGLFSE